MNNFLRIILRAEYIMMGLLGVAVLFDDRLFGSVQSLPLQIIAVTLAAVILVANVVLARRQLKQMREEVAHAQSVDALTGLYNHRKIQDVVKDALRQAEQTGSEVSLIYFDLDDFKPINDNYGHSVGDEVLLHVVGILTQYAPEGAILGRYAGDEFVMVLPGVTAAESDRIAAAYQERLSNERFSFHQYEEALPIIVSMGVANYPHDAKTGSQLIEYAQTSTAQAKQEGKAKVQRVPTFMQIEKYIAYESAHELMTYALSLKDKDTYTVQHSEDVARYALILADELALPELMKRELRTAGILHDIGKILIPDHVLKKPGRLTDDEYAMMKKHVVMSHEILAEHYTSETMKQAVICHHERFDGKGYPFGLQGAQIPLVGRIMAIADAFSAMTLDRAYRKCKTLDEGMAELRRCAGTQFDPELVEAFCRAIESRREQLERGMGETDTAS